MSKFKKGTLCLPLLRLDEAAGMAILGSELMKQGWSLMIPSFTWKVGNQKHPNETWVAFDSNPFSLFGSSGPSENKNIPQNGCLNLLLGRKGMLF